MSSKKILQLSVAFFFFIALGLTHSFTVRSQNPSSNPVQTPTPEWRPNQVPNGKFVGSKVCAECHDSKASTQMQTHMGRALFSGANNEVFRLYKKLTFRQGNYNYQITSDGDKSTYTVSDGVNSISLPIQYSFGSGEAGQTYVLQYKNRFYESRLSYYADIRGLDFTMGHNPVVPPTLDDAMGREIGMEETRSCFGCHTTGAVSGRKFQLDQFMEGVTCEACHGPGEKHVVAMKAGAEGPKQIYNPAKLNTDDLSNFCGTCHRTWDQVISMGLKGVVNVRFQPYRLSNSKCYDTDDKRISCTACHDPHEDRKHEAAYYDAKCTACHNPKNKPTKAGFSQATKRVALPCPTNKNNCTTCHMPKIQLPGSHFKFSDHQIRVVKPGDPYPN